MTVTGIVWRWQTTRAVQAAKLFESSGRITQTVEGFDPVKQALVRELYECRSEYDGIHVRLTAVSVTR